MTYAQKEERCKSCYYYNESSNWCWPCDECADAIATLVKPTKDYFRIKALSQKEKIMSQGGSNGNV